MNHFEEDPLEQMLSAESDEEFGLPEFLTSPSENLKNWTAQDFSNIYVRYYPHLLRHAKKFLTNHSQAEEVVQDAFLYLMTSLPEVDSEVGVLKLLKWKVRLLALDVIQINGKAKFASFDDVDLVAEETELDERLIRADEAAIISMALAKLSPRQREVIISSVYEEKEASLVALQLGLTENATRQLLFRARSAFKKALVGEAETAGMSVTKILSVAARKAAQDSGKYIAAASALLVVLAISIGILPNLGQQAQTNLANSSPSSETLSQAPSANEDESVELVPSEEPVTEVVEDLEVVEEQVVSEEATLASAAMAPRNEPEAAMVETVNLVTPVNQPTAIRTASLSPYLDLSVQQAEFGKQGTSFFPNASHVLKIHSGVGLWAFVDYNPTEMTISAVGFEVMVDGVKYYGSPRAFGTATTASDVGYNLTYSATEMFLIDAERNVLSEHSFASAFVTISIQLDKAGEPIAANLFIKGR
jgi:RNA polymerase sigma factor (sigma-70 family)